MTKSNATTVTAEQEAIIVKLSLEGLGNRKIAKLNLPELNGLSEQQIFGTIKRKGLCNQKKSAAGKKGHPTGRITQKRLRILTFLKTEEATTSKHAAAHLGVTEQLVISVRQSLNLSTSEREAYQKAVKAETAKSKKSGSRRRRIELFLSLRLKQKQLEKEGCRKPKKKCAACCNLWFDVDKFYYLYEEKGKKTGWWCKVCYGERAMLLHQGMEAKKILAEIRKRPWVAPLVTTEELEAKLNFEFTEGELKKCRGLCKKFFWPTRTFFRLAKQNGKVILSDICLACLDI